MSYAYLYETLERRNKAEPLIDNYSNCFSPENESVDPLALSAQPLVSFAPRTTLNGNALQNISFVEEMEVFDTLNFKTDKIGLDFLSKQLATVRKIRFLRITQFSKYTILIDDHVELLVSQIHPSIWPHVEVLFVENVPDLH
jgi:hypothetical protein